MRHCSRFLLALALAVGTSSQAGAILLSLSGGTLGFGIGALPPINFPLANPQTIDVTAQGGFVEPLGAFTGIVQLPTSLFTGVPLINGLTIEISNGEKVINTANVIAGPRATGVVRPGNGTLGGPGALVGSSFVNALGLFNLSIPLSPVGNTGGFVNVVGGGLTIQVLGTGWTTGEVTLQGITTETPNGQEVHNAQFIGFDNRATAGTQQHAGTIQLISPFKVVTIGAGAGNLPGLALQTLTFISAPEPGEILLLGSAVVSVALLGRRRLRR